MARPGAQQPKSILERVRPTKQARDNRLRLNNNTGPQMSSADRDKFMSLHRSKEVHQGITPHPPDSLLSRPSTASSTPTPTFLQCPILQYSHKISLPLPSLPHPPGSPTSPPSASDVSYTIRITSVRRRWVVSRTRLQPNGRIGIEMRHNALQSLWDAIAVHSAGALSAGASRGLGIEVGVCLGAVGV